MGTQAIPVWIVGKVTNARLSAWEFQGAFELEADAVAQCKTDMWFVGPATLNEPAPEEPTGWKGAYYPLSPINSSSLP